MAQEYTEKIPQHRHCHLCGKAFIGDGKFCSVECQESETKEVKGKLKKYALVLVAIWAVTIVLVVLVL